MIYYKDMTFCPFWCSCDDGHDCDRALTEGVKEGAEDWWGNEEAPICLYTDKPDCFKDAIDI